MGCKRWQMEMTINQCIAMDYDILCNAMKYRNRRLLISGP
jgi:hypothetical protein